MINIYKSSFNNKKILFFVIHPFSVEMHEFFILFNPLIFTINKKKKMNLKITSTSEKINVIRLISEEHFGIREIEKFFERSYVFTT